MAITTKNRRHVSLLDQVVLFPDGAITSIEDRGWELANYFSLEGAPPPVFVATGGSIDDTLDADFYDSTAGQATAESLTGWNVALDGRTYLIDVLEYERTILDSQTPQVDDAAEPGEKSLSRLGFWTREQTDWRNGAGQLLFDAQEADRTRFLESKGVYVWERGQLSMLPDTRKKLASTEDNLTCFDVGGRLYVVDGQFLRFTANSDPESPTFTSVDVDADIADTTTDGDRIYIAFGGANPLKVVDVGGAVDTTLGVTTPDIVEFCNGRLVGADGPLLYEIDSAGAKTDIYDDPRNTWTWVAITGHPEAIFAAGTVNDVSEIYAIGLEPTSTALGAPTFAGNLRRGETVNCLGSYGGLIVIGTSQGIRVATVTSARLFIGELIEIPGGVRALSFFGRFCWFTWTNFDTTSTGLGRLDMSVVTSPDTFVPGYASDILAEGTQGTATGVAQHLGKQFFTIAGSGLWGETTYRVPTASIESGDIRFSVLADKMFTGVEVHHDPLLGSVGATIRFTDGTERSLGSNDSPGSVVSTLDSAQGVGLSASLRMVLFRDIDDPTSGPVVKSWIINALARPKRVTEIILPITLKSKVTNLRTQDVIFDPLEEVRHLESLASTGRFVVYQEGAATYQVKVDSVALPKGKARAWTNTKNTWFQSTVLVRLLTKES